ncbi:bifunctional hydroxymethylpyrimidine kinase/phosphomethylpyrimidine kinase [Sphingomonas crusticola]|uniref:bifunctional hydroxymethylpyrimidine kinase/phosphomethylpyrimidine kinase n=1 Tax=Sphingomonas crusticola TaxID=1697973 RepID=UPI000E251DDD|nr:bifunctional hydroxymethylpyrimidine kinase/phosphomethylpyrimidine kinase [Sphingomonas crusticola]
MIPRVLAIAGSDSGGGAGIQADIKTITMLGGHAMTAITAITAQNTLGVTKVMPVPTDMVLAQIDAVVGDIGVDAVKIGMIGSARTAWALAERLDPQRPCHESAPPMQVVFDPVMVATSGAVLADDETIAAFEALMRRSTLVTPNVPELEILTGRKIATVEELLAAALVLAKRTGTQILAKGGHLPTDEVYDVHVISDELNSYGYGPRPRIQTRHSHGTGCTLSSAIATGLASGRPIAEAILDAQNYVRATLEAAPGLGAGHGPMGHGLGRAHFPV